MVGTNEYHLKVEIVSDTSVACGFMESVDSKTILRLVNKSKIFTKSQLPDGECFRIAAVDDSYNSTGKVFLTVLVEGTGRVFTKSVHDIFYNQDWLKKFSKEDVARIAYLHAAEIEKKPHLVDTVINETLPKTNNIQIIAVIYTTFLILSNISALKISSVLGYSIPSGLVFFPLTYIFNDILTEVYGFKVSRRVIWLGLISNLIITVGIYGIIHLTPSPYWSHQREFETIFALSPRIFAASVLSYFCGEFINSTIIAKLKIFTDGKYLWLRVAGSTAIGVGIESILFAFIAFWSVFPKNVLLEMILIQVLFKVGYELIALPVTYKVIEFLKKVDGADYYDFATKFNPFSFRLED